ncbi:hypothetical protein MSKOL_2285 [Methanosarcina sp. Kolksee]|uniref:SIR2 family protein n=1 Tax=Methanosarcina sp. Kolksee TaxID=1434099 RepID=UPI000615F2E5|nr:SIR2 family protein [Methanosarcina sp. Kolksee]AKB48062.1 hypothetical protein MSKOL_2285 [Methanosarcina sp. Kolksee]
MNNYEYLQDYFKKNSECRILLGNNDKTALIIGNGITRLALDSPSWYNWIKDLWIDIKPDIPFDYMRLREVTLPECIQYLLDNSKDSENKRRLIYKSLWEATEKIDISRVNLEFHELCINSFRVFFTTNYDTLLERICLKNNIAVDVHVIKANSPNIEPPVSILPPTNNPKTKITLVKLHGSFSLAGIESRILEKPEDYIFDRWWLDSDGGNTIVAGVRQYSNIYPHSANLIQKLRSDCPNIRAIQYLIFLGYGMKSEDDIVAQLSKRTGTQMQLAMTYGGDTVDDLRYKGTWLINHLSMPAYKGGAKKARIRAHCDFLQYLINPKFCDSIDNSNPSQCIVIGQASVVNVVRVGEPPAQERSYRITEGPTYPKEKGLHKYVTKYVAGQMLTPALFLDRWNLKSLFVSLIGYDEAGLEIRNELIKKENIDWSYVLQDNHVITDNSFVVTHDEFRTLYDSGLDFDKTKDIIQDSLQKISDSIEDKNIRPSLIYVCKWYLEEITLNNYLKGWVEQGKNPLVCYETGSRGSNPDSRGDFFIESKIGENCDVMLASSLFVMRAFRMPLFDIKSKTLSQKFDPNIPLNEWDRIYNNDAYQRFDYRNRASQNLNFVLGLNHLKIDRIISLFFESETAKKLFYKVSWWIITLGDMGMVAISKNHRNGWWVSPQEIAKEDILNALGCGDVSRGGFIGYYLKKVYEGNYQNSDYSKEKYFLENKDLVINAVKCAVYAGTEKIKYFKLDDAISELSWDKIETCSNNLIEKELDSSTLDEMVKLVLT